MIETRQASSLGELIDAVRELTRVFRTGPQGLSETWLRGASRARYDLVPSLYRPSNSSCREDEASMLQWFMALAPRYAAAPPASEWEWYFLARHHGLPSRLIDWTESLLVAVYFALEKRVAEHDKPYWAKKLESERAAPKYDDDSPVIWILEPGSLNAHALGPDDDCVISPGGDTTAKYFPGSMPEKSTDAQLPLAILPPRSSDRMVAQQGLFTIHGRDDTPINELAGRSSADGVKVGKILLDSENLIWLWDDMETAGVSSCTVFPDLDRICDEIREDYISPKL